MPFVRVFIRKANPQWAVLACTTEVSVQCHLVLMAATVGSLEKSAGTLSNILETLVEHYFNNYQLAHLPPASPCMCSLPPRTGLRRGVIRAFRNKKKQEMSLCSYQVKKEDS